MVQIKEHIISKVLVVILSITLLTPLFVKLNHLFEDHKHEVCKTPYKNHFHSLELDCDYYDFRLNTNFYQSISSIEIYQDRTIDKAITSKYHFVSDYQQLHFSLRGPPLSV